jgi:hypothetical protein
MLLISPGTSAVRVVCTLKYQNTETGAITALVLDASKWLSIENHRYLNLKNNTVQAPLEGTDSSTSSYKILIM